MVKIEVRDPVMSECSDIHKVKECLKYHSAFWRQGPSKKTKEDQIAFLCNHNWRSAKGTLLTGFLPRVEEYCARNGIKLEISRLPRDIQLAEAELPAIAFRADQLRILSGIKKNGRGVVISPTGSGKTVLAGGVISMLPESSCAVFVVHTKSLFRQTVEEFGKWFGQINVIGDSEFSIGRINVVMAQTARSLLTKENRQTAGGIAFIDLLLNKTDAIIIDECHHITDENGQYSSLMKICAAEVRLGLTATPAKGKAGLVCEGYIGPVIGEFSMGEGIEKGILAKPHVKLIPVPISASIESLWQFKDSFKENEYGKMDKVEGIYTAGIIKNKQRNRLIAKEIAMQNKAGISVLVMITDVTHGQAEQIKEIAAEIYDTNVEIVQGSTESKKRELIKKKLESKETMAAIATSVWREGINIKSLGCIINGCGGKAEIMTLQAIGRGLRTTDGKTDLVIVDFLDPYRYLAQHTIQRLKIYVENGWL